ncbi:histidine--tRNA ligase [Amorphus orientalis]|uniref:Histidine--tRNA ligase n=1 Tax=Amorphus orientalis TaxID=649198 RepID=A0AAE3VNJ2_9HYPH|nr:histidine--tRNA ligase [Amorphus orientalis]MDQ0315232.1 histidyl-tRNA synthetase [Amorphus orientalis]
MSRDKDNLPKARLPRGFADRSASEIKAAEQVMAKIRAVYERYGFEPVETPFVEYAEALGKFLPDQDRPNEGVFAFQDDDEDWLSLRYDLTAPLARHVAENYERIVKPYRTYRAGWVFRNEKPGPGRFRQFMQFDADTVGAASVAADAEICMMAADTMEAIGIPRGDYVIRVNNRKVLDGVMEAAGLGGDGHAGTRLSVLRAIDKLDKFGPDGVRLLLGKGRMDESGDYTKGAGLDADTVAKFMTFIDAATSDLGETFFSDLEQTTLGESDKGKEGLAELAEIREMIDGAGYGERVKIDPSVVRGLEYYTGPVFEAELTFEITDEDGRPVRFGSVGGGGRYDGLVGRFRGEDMPATGFSVGVSRLVAALAAREGEQDKPLGPVVIMAMDRDPAAMGAYQRFAREIRAGLANAGLDLGCEVYLGSSGMKAQMKYADRRNAPCVVIQGSSERETGTVQIKDLIEGARIAKGVTDNKTWREERFAQTSVAESEMVATVVEVVSRYIGTER